MGLKKAPPPVGRGLKESSKNVKLYAKRVQVSKNCRNGKNILFFLFKCMRKNRNSFVVKWEKIQQSIASPPKPYSDRRVSCVSAKRRLIYSDPASHARRAHRRCWHFLREGWSGPIHTLRARRQLAQSRAASCVS